MSTRQKSILTFMAVYLSITFTASSQLVIDTSTNWTGTSMGSFGSAGILGQTFGVDIDNTRLDYFSLYVADNVDPDYMTFNFHVMEWSIPQLKAVGSVLYSSDAVVSSNNQGNDGWEKITFSTGGLELNANKVYIAIIAVPNGVNGTCWLGYAGDVYSGEFAYTQGDIGNINNLSWTTDYPGLNGDLVCEIGFNIPEPATFLLFSLGLICLGQKKLKK